MSTEVMQMREMFLNDASDGFVAEWLIASLRFVFKQDVNKVFLSLSGALIYIPCTALLEVQELLQEDSRLPCTFFMWTT